LSYGLAPGEAPPALPAVHLDDSGAGACDHHQMTWAAPRLPSRREVLAGGAALALGGCLPVEGSSPGPTVAPERRRRARIAGEVRALTARYDAVIARHPETRAGLSTLAAEHEAHAAALLGPAGTSSPTASPSPSGTSTTTTPAPVPDSVEDALAGLAAAELAASRRRGRQARRASPGLARLLASIAACEAAHAALLEREA
jgi:hypothetical protein